jgi:hypothetical protein
MNISKIAIFENGLNLMVMGNGQEIEISYSLALELVREKKCAGYNVGGCMIYSF